MKPVWIPALVFTCSLTLSAAPTVDFARDVQPVFESHCVQCHGPEEQKSSFRLDLRDAATRGGDHGRAILPGNASESPILQRITATRGDDLRMPPKGEGLSLNEIDTLRAWIDQGAAWPDESAGKDARLDHWAWQPVRNVAPPASESSHPIDAFILRRLGKAGLSLSPPADRRTLIRRLSFDLLGLPPAPEEIDAFVNDPDPDAYGKLVDRLLASTHYGERYARHWLDIAHYADTHGFERDKRRDHAWRYRDYVIRALNQDKPYDRFLREQIAGDVLRPDDPDAVVATGFLAAGPWDFVGQIETKSDVLRRSARALDLDDMVTQVMTATLAMTVNCARCHDHKLDPITQKEYYRLWSVFAGVKRDERVISEAAVAEHEAEKRRLTAERNRIDFALEKIQGHGIDLADIVGGGNGLGTGNPGQGIDTRTGKPQTRPFGRLGNVKPNHLARSEFPFIDGVLVPNGEDGKARIPVSSTGLTISGLPSTSKEAWDMIRNGPVASQHSTELEGIDFAQGGHSLLGLHANAGITFDLRAIRQALGGAGLRFTAKAGYFGKEGNMLADLWVFLDGNKMLEFRGLKRADGLKEIDLSLPKTARFLTLISTDGGDGIGHDQIGFGDPRLKPDAPSSLSSEDRRTLAGMKQERETLEAKLRRLGPPPKVYAVVAQKETPEIRVLRRGNPESPMGEPLEPGALSALPMLDPYLGDRSTLQGRRRAALADWITNPQNPLTRRVIVNRLWHWHFGQGIVTTPSDFGLGGAPPSHPELLDWLAEELLRQGWSLKAIHRLILTSAAYQQQSRFTPDAPGLTVDAGNRLLWRQNPRRLEAEAIRDTVLAVSGKLNPEVGGPGFEDFKYQEAYAPIYTYITADQPELWRRSIYRYIVRTTPSRFMTTLDCPDPANLTPKRLTTTTPLQSLALFNNDFMLRQADYFAERVRREAGTQQRDQVARTFRLAFGRHPSKKELRLGTAFIAKEGLFAFCRSVLNANEFVYVD